LDIGFIRPLLEITVPKKMPYILLGETVMKGFPVPHQRCGFGGLQIEVFFPNMIATVINGLYSLSLKNH
jgi:hypothetical protein